MKYIVPFLLFALVGSRTISAKPSSISYTEPAAAGSN
jgi:hypothetical protein